MFIKSVQSLTLAGIMMFPVTAQDLRSFSKRADDLSQQVQACYKNEVGRDNGRRKQKEAISFVSQGKTYTAWLTTEGFENLKAAAAQQPGSSFVAFSQEMGIGDTSVVKRTYRSLTKEARSRKDELDAQWQALAEQKAKNLREKNKDYQGVLNQLESLKPEFIKILGQEYDERIFGDGKIKFHMEQPKPGYEWGALAQYLEIQGTKYFGRNADDPKVRSFLLSKEGTIWDTWQQDRRHIVCLSDLQRIGLIDSVDLRCGRYSMYGISFDAWMAGKEPKEATTVGIAPGVVLPTWQGRSTPIVVNKDIFTTTWAPNQAVTTAKTFKETGERFCSTAMVPTTHRTSLNITQPYTRPDNVPLLRFDRADSTIPMVGLDTKNRMFLVTWVAFNKHNGVVFMVQYEDEKSPRIAYADPSGVFVRMVKDSIGLVVKKLVDESGDEGYEWGPNVVCKQTGMNYHGEPNKRGRRSKAVKTHEEMLKLGGYKAPQEDRKDARNEVYSTTFVMPRALF